MHGEEAENGNLFIQATKDITALDGARKNDCTMTILKKNPGAVRVRLNGR
jgi:hypothetical protein